MDPKTNFQHGGPSALYRYIAMKSYVMISQISLLQSADRWKIRDCNSLSIWQILRAPADDVKPANPSNAFVIGGVPTGHTNTSG